MQDCGLTFHHLGIAVKDPKGISTYLTALGYKTGASVYDPLQYTHVMMWRHISMPDVELIWPGDGPSPIDRVVKNGTGVIYHQCYVTQDIEASLTALQNTGLAVLPVVEPKPAILFGKVEVSFYAVENVGIIEIIHGAPIET
jgi:hypothetical protein